MLDISYQRQGRFTVCVAIDGRSERIYTGVAFCAPDDDYSEDIGQAISYGRAMNLRADDYAQRAFAQ